MSFTLTVLVEQDFGFIGSFLIVGTICVNNTAAPIQHVSIFSKQITNITVYSKSKSEGNRTNMYSSDFFVRHSGLISLQALLFHFILQYRRWVLSVSVKYILLVASPHSQTLMYLS